MPGSGKFAILGGAVLLCTNLPINTCSLDDITSDIAYIDISLSQIRLVLVEFAIVVEIDFPFAATLTCPLPRILQRLCLGHR